jgi:ubiquinone/menaquinone biosynthesis C-methylase UbiE
MDAQSIRNMSYTDFIAFIKETNRCPGGKDSIRKIIQNSFINENSYVLEIGSNTGFTSLEIAHISKCKVEGIDISQACVDEANSRLNQDVISVKKNVRFSLGSAYNIPFKDNTFDLVVAGGATSFMNEKNTAITEYLRVLKYWGFLSVTQLFYIQTPPKHLLESVSKIIGIDIQPWTGNDWLDVFKTKHENLELYYYEKNYLQNRSVQDIDNYIKYFMSKSHIRNLNPTVKQLIYDKWKGYIDVFNENHKYLAYFIALFRKDLYPEESELFIRK